MYSGMTTDTIGARGSASAVALHMREDRPDDLPVREVDGW